MFSASSYIFMSTRAGSSNSRTQTSDLYPVGVTNNLTETGTYAAEKPQPYLHKNKEAPRLMVSQLCTDKERCFGNLAVKEILAEHVQTDVFIQAYNFLKFD